MKKRILSLVLTFAMLSAVPMSVSAETLNGSDDWAVSFNGSKMESNFKSADLDEVIYDMQPGDTAEFQVALTNKHSKDTDWYMSNEILQSLEESTSSAEGGAYGYLLTYTSADGTVTELYNSDAVGGEDTSAGEGLHQATNSLEDYFYLDRLASGKSGYVNLSVTLEGETLGNDYQNTLARLQMTFAAEEAPEGETTMVTGETKHITKIATVKTGDESNLMLYISLAALAAGLIVLILVLRKFRKDQDEQAVQAEGRSIRRNRRGDR